MSDDSSSYEERNAVSFCEQHIYRYLFHTYLRFLPETGYSNCILMAEQKKVSESMCCLPRSNSCTGMSPLSSIG
jgi:hypothetical protein